ncbi:MAG: hypothetical protein P4L65_09485 [Legionella sp.]|nr:hypothetical protein [Legionella sp.]
MFKTTNLAVFTLIALLSNEIYAKTIHLNPNETKSLANNSLWTVNATCNIQSKGQTANKIRIVVLKNHGAVNGKNLSSGQATSVSVKNNSSISVSADAGTEINLINLSSEGLQAVCSS